MFHFDELRYFYIRYSEVENYDFNRPANNYTDCDPTPENSRCQIGHFTQVVWKGTTTMGIGKATSNEGTMKCVYVVGRYSPAGNFNCEYAKNVGPAQGKHEIKHPKRIFMVHLQIT